MYSSLLEKENRSFSLLSFSSSLNFVFNRLFYLILGLFDKPFTFWYIFSFRKYIYSVIFKRCLYCGKLSKLYFSPKYICLTWDIHQTSLLLCIYFPDGPKRVEWSRIVQSAVYYLLLCLVDQSYGGNWLTLIIAPCWRVTGRDRWEESTD